jgi:hypothetical protein
MSEPAVPTSIYQLRFVLRHVTPMVWRRVLVRSDTTLVELHRIIQITMGWEDTHLHCFRIHGRDYSSSGIGSTFAGDPHAVTLDSLRLHLRERFGYTYDFGAWWQHDIRLEQVVVSDPRRTYPVCIGGKHACPPEDCAGPNDYRARLCEPTSLAAFDDLALVADVVGRWLDHDVCGTEEEQVEVEAALGRMAERLRLGRDRFNQRAVNAALKQLSEGAVHRP